MPNYRSGVDGLRSATYCCGITLLLRRRKMASGYDHGCPRVEAVDGDPYARFVATFLWWTTWYEPLFLPLSSKKEIPYGVSVQLSWDGSLAFSCCKKDLRQGSQAGTKIIWQQIRNHSEHPSNQAQIWKLRYTDPDKNRRGYLGRSRANGHMVSGRTMRKLFLKGLRNGLFVASTKVIQKTTMESNPLWFICY